MNQNIKQRDNGLELDHLSLPLLVATDLEVFAPLNRQLFTILALRALHPEYDLLSGLGLLPEDGFGLPTKAALFSVVSSSALSERRLLALLVLGHLMDSVFAALALAVSAPRLRHVHHCWPLFG